MPGVHLILWHSTAFLNIKCKKYKNLQTKCVTTSPGLRYIYYIPSTISIKRPWKNPLGEKEKRRRIWRSEWYRKEKIGIQTSYENTGEQRIKWKKEENWKQRATLLPRVWQSYYYGWGFGHWSTPRANVYFHGGLNSARGHAEG